MPTSVRLQDMMSYSMLFTIIAIAVIVLPIIVILILKLIGYKPKKREKKVKIKPAAPEPKYDARTLKMIYLDKVNEVETRYRTSLIDLRKAHQELSAVVREYCSKASGIPADKLTLKELSRINRPALFELIRQFYHPEFAYDSAKDINASLAGAREVIMTWN